MGMNLGFPLKEAKSDEWLLSGVTPLFVRYGMIQGLGLGKNRFWGFPRKPNRMDGFPRGHSLMLRSSKDVLGYTIILSKGIPDRLFP